RKSGCNSISGLEKRIGVSFDRSQTPRASQDRPGQRFPTARKSGWESRAGAKRAEDSPGPQRERRHERLTCCEGGLTTLKDLTLTPTVPLFAPSATEYSIVAA